MKISNYFIALLMLSNATFGFVLASRAQPIDTTPITPSASPVTPPSTPSAAPPSGAMPDATPPATPSAPTGTPDVTSPVAPSTPSVTPEATPSATPTTPSGTTPEPSPSPSAPVYPSSSGTPSGPSGGGALAPDPTASTSSESGSQVLAICGKNGASFLVAPGETPVGCNESRINRPPAAALK